MPGNGLFIFILVKNNSQSRISQSSHHSTVETGFVQKMNATTCRIPRMLAGMRIRLATCLTRVAAGGLVTLSGCDFMVAGTFHVPSAIQKPSVFEATAHSVCMLLSGDSKKS